MAPMLKLAALTACLLIQGALSVDIAFVNGADCNGTGLYGTKGIPYLPCYDLSSLDPAMSVHMRNMTEGQVLHLYSDNSCQIALYSASSIDAQCFTSPIGKFGSFQVSASHTMVSVDRRDTSNTTNVEPYAVKLSDYTAMGTFEPTNMDLGLSIFTLGLGLVAVNQGVTIYGTVNTCLALKGPKPSAKDYFDCAIQPVGSICGIAGTALIHVAGKRVQRRLELASGNNVALKKRTEFIDALNSDFVHSVMNSTIDEGVLHVGFAERNMSTGTHSSPVYEIDFGDGGVWHYTSFYEHEYDDFIHHVRSSSESPLDKRSAPNPYNTIRWGSGGFDFAYCDYHKSSPASGFNNRNRQQIYDIAYDQIACFHTRSYYSNAKALGIDLHNEDGVIVGELEIIPYTGKKRPTPPACTTKAYPQNQDCDIS